MQYDCMADITEFFMTWFSPGLGDSINMAHCKMHYYTSHPTLNYFAVIPKGGEACQSQLAIPFCCKNNLSASWDFDGYIAQSILQMDTMAVIANPY